VCVCVNEFCDRVWVCDGVCIIFVLGSVSVRECCFDFICVYVCLCECNYMIVFGCVRGFVYERV